MHSTTSTRAFVPAVILAAVLALAVPARWQGWARWTGDKIDLAVAPVSRPVVQLASWLRGARTPPDDDAVRVLEEDNEKLRQDLLATRQENTRLAQVIADLQHGVALNPEVRARRLLATVFGVTGKRPSMLKVQAGERQGVNTSTIALAPGLQLVGRVVGVGNRTCELLPITSPGGTPLIGVVIVDPSSPDGLRCTLSPTGDGTLRGPVEDRRGSGGEVVRPQVGQTVRLDDAAWPRAARMVMLGRIESIEPSPGQPLRSIVTVRPTVSDMDRLSEVILWIPEVAP